MAAFLAPCLHSVDQIRADPDPKSRRTKMVFTLGPACWSVEGLVALIDAGMGVARFNFSHGTHEGHKATLDRLREAMAQRPDHLVAVCLGKFWMKDGGWKGAKVFRRAFAAPFSFA